MSRRILLVEEDKKLAHGLRYNLEAEGYKLRVARDGVSGLHCARNGVFDLILLDVNLPERDGLEVLERLRAHGDATPVILLSAQAGEQERIRGLGLGADDYLTKPFSLGELLARIRARVRAAQRVEILSGALHGRGLASLVDRALELTGAERGLVLLRNGTPGLRVVVARDHAGRNLPHDVRYSTSIAGHVLESGNAESLIDPGDGVSWTGGSVVEMRLRHVLCAPIESGDQRVGALYADSRVSAPGFSNRDLELFKTLAYQCGEVIEKRRMRDSLREARDMQRALMPRRPESGGRLEVAGLNRPLEEAGGDYLDYIRLGPGRLTLALGDAAGHGLGAALLMTTTRSLLRTFLTREADAAAALTQVNRALIRDMPPGRFMSLFVGALETESGRLRYASAGHNSALLLRAGSGAFEELEPTGPALGVVKTARYRLFGTAPMQPGDLLLLYTDGLTEAMNGAHELFGMERLKRLLESLRGRSAAEIVSGIVGAVTRFAGSGVADDCSLVVVRGV